MKQKIFLLIVSVISLMYIESPVFGQVVGGTGVYEFLNLPVSARVSGLGGSVLGVQDADLNIALVNPAALNKKK